MEQRFVVNGINNDKIELVSNYDVRKLNRLLDAKDQMWLTKVKMAREEISEMRKEHNVSVTDCLDVLDKLIAEAEE